MPGTIGQWASALNTLARAPKDLKEAKHRALLMEAQFFRGEIIAGMTAQAPAGQPFKPLSITTLAMRKFFGFNGTKALLERGDLRNAITVFEVTDGAVFVGVLRTAKNAKGEPLVDVARIQEEGSKPIVIKITPKMAALLHMAFRAFGATSEGHKPSGTGIIVVQIPARPFMGPVFEKHGQPEEASKRFAERVQKLMKGKGPWQALNGATSGLK